MEEQKCVDPDKTTSGDWYCECLPPQVGKGEAMSLASCTGVRCSDFHDEPVKCNELDGCFHDGVACTTSPPVIGCARWNNDNVTCDNQADCYHNDTLCLDKPPTNGCGRWNNDPSTCNLQQRCFHNGVLCVGVRTLTPTLTLTLSTNDSNIFGAALGDDDDDCGWWCILLIILAILCCFLILAALWWRRRKNAGDVDDEKWNKQFHAQVDENVEGDPMDADDAPTTPYSEMADKEPIKDEDI